MGHLPRHSARARPRAVRTTLPSWQRDGASAGSQVAGHSTGLRCSSGLGGLRGCVLGSGSRLLGWTQGSTRAALFISEQLITH